MATGELLTSQEVAALLGVSASSVKRWAEEGRLACIKTAGQHRRFERAAVERFRLGQLAPGEAPGDDLLAALLGAEEPRVVEARLLDERARLGSWWQVAEGLGLLLDELGRRWEDGRISVLQEHLASERLHRALARVCEWLPVASQAPRALLATADGDDHTLGLSLVEVCLREQGWRTLWAGRGTPTGELIEQLGTLLPPVRLLAVSASASSSDARDLGRQARRLGEACRTAHVALCVGGAGRWPETLEYGTRLRALEGLVAYARDLA